MKSFNRNQITIYATEELLSWVKKAKPELHRWTIETINHRPTAYLIDIEDQNCHGLILKEYYKKIVENELCENLYIDKNLWPKDISYDLFTKWFTYQYHEEVYDLCAEPLEVYDE
ncbi:hypothetical protein [Celerinatantimonas sp. MCCC 1A17872]|uniref:hypothetical protein n=1 Tax=Celerinatantimonas sp. MCCC 1A17872 TaxID=3177514 RepID=UPI0038C6BFDA